MKEYNVEIANTSTTGNIHWASYTGHSADNIQYSSPYYSWYYSYPTTHYLYQIFCPKRGCKTANWLELDAPKPCTKCSSMLRAVSKKIDFEVEVGV